MRYKAAYDYTASDADEVSFSEGDVIINVTVIDEGWVNVSPLFFFFYFFHTWFRRTFEPNREPSKRRASTACSRQTTLNPCKLAGPVPREQQFLK